ncbi:MAG TPA: plastocyanin/azurin family copper-binding protein [Gemmatimonadaceae bacterium]|nr:plastocyanin/azurin family copper-binding protein [Gemmatimonadaceae bacterium]
MNKSRYIAGLLAVAAIASALPLRAEHRAATIVVRMLGDEKGFRFQPASVTAHVGDVVRFVNVSGGPHNVAFSADRIPPGTAAKLQKNMGETDGALNGAMISEPNATYTISLAGLRPGTYNYHCVPHQAMNMVGRITVR